MKNTADYNIEDTAELMVSSEKGRRTMLIVIAASVVLLLILIIIFYARGETTHQSLLSTPDYLSDDDRIAGVELDKSLWKKIDPKGDEYVVVFNTDEENISEIPAGTVIGQYYTGEYELIISKPLLNEDEGLSNLLEQRGYNYVMVTQIRGDLNYNYVDESYSVVMFFPNEMEVRTYENSEVRNTKFGNGDLNSNFEFVPNTLIRYGSDVTRADGSLDDYREDSVTDISTWTEVNNIRYFIENKGSSQ